MYKLIGQVDKVKPSSFKINNNDVYINKDNIIEVFRNGNKREFIKLSEKSKVTMIINNEVWVADLLTGKTFFYNTEQKEANFIATTFRDVSYFIYGKYVFAHTYFNGDFSKRFYAKINIQGKQIEEIYNECGFNGIYQVLNDNLFLSQNNEKFGVFTFENKCVWECNYKDLFSAYEPIGAGTTNIIKVNNKLYVELDKTYCLDIETGKKEQVYDYKFTTSENEFLYGLQFLSMTEFQLAILDTKSNTVKIIDVSDEFNQLNVYPDNRIIVKDGLVYFSQNMGDIIAKIGVLNPETGKILWKYDFDKKNGMLSTIKVNGNRIYAHTQDKTLHIFEKTPKLPTI